MKRTISMIIRVLLVNCMVVCANLAVAQLEAYPEIYPNLPFNLAKVAELGYMKCTVWRGIYTAADGDQSGVMWSSPVEESYQYQRYVFPDGKMETITVYQPNGDKKSTMEFFYKQNLLSAVEKLAYDSLQTSTLDFTYAYFYKHDGFPFQRVKMYGHPNKSVRLLDEFEFDSLNRVVRQKTTAVGSSPQMDSLVGLKDKEQKLTLTEYTDSTLSRRAYKNLYVLLNDKKTFLNPNKQAAITKVRNSRGKVLFTIDYKYSNGKLSQKLHWVMRELTTLKSPLKAEEKLKKKKKRKKKNKIEATVVAQTPKTLGRPEIYKIEYFMYSKDGILERHIIEEGGTQTILEYTYFTE